MGLSFTKERKGPVLPAPERGGWTKRSVDAGEVTKWLHALLSKSGNEASPGTTSHTVKSTVQREVRDGATSETSVGTSHLGGWIAGHLRQGHSGPGAFAAYKHAGVHQKRSFSS